MQRACVINVKLSTAQQYNTILEQLLVLSVTPLKIDQNNKKNQNRSIDGLQHGGRKQTEMSVTEFLYKNVNISLGELKNVKKIPFLVHELFR